MADGNAPPSDPSGTPPSGEVSDTATCCPLVSTFDGSPRPERVYGYDFRTNLVDNRGSSEEYWTPAAKGKSAPGDRYTRDGAAWASVGLGMEADLEISFEGHSGIGCLMNCRFEPEGPGVVELVTQKVNSDKAVFTVRGIAEGETTLIVTCDGADIGWVHVVCYRQIVIDAIVGNLQGQWTTEVAYDPAALQQFLNRVFKQALIKFELQDVGTIDLRESAAMQYIENTSVGKFSFSNWPIYPGTDAHGDLTEVDHMRYIYLDGTTEVKLAIELEKLTQPYLTANHPGKLALFYFVPSDAPSQFSGTVPDVGRGPSYVLTDLTTSIAPFHFGIPDTYAVHAHEVGHAFNLHHPDAEPCYEVPEHLRKSVMQPVAAEPATNTYMAVNPTGLPIAEERNSKSIMARDPLNLMGYWPVFQHQTALVKGQWDKARVGAHKYRRKGR